MDHQYYAELVGIAAAAASLYAANAKTIIPLRIAAIVANVLNPSVEVEDAPHLWRFGDAIHSVRHLHHCTVDVAPFERMVSTNESNITCDEALIPP